MAINVSLKASNAKPTVGDKVTVTATTTGQAEGATLAYAWTVDGKSVDGTASTLDYTPTAKGDSTVAATVTATVTGETPSTDNGTGSVKITASNKQFKDLTITLSASPTSAKIGDKVTVTATVNSPSTATTAIAWTVDSTTVSGETGTTYEFTADKAGATVVEATATVKQDGYDDANVESDKLFVTVNQPDYETGTVDFYNPLPQRNSVFYRAGWWVMDLIDESVAKGVDWTDPVASKLKYADELRTIAKLVNDFEHVEIQESRNGRIVGKDAIKAGKIYSK